MSTRKKWAPPTAEEREAILARNAELDKERIRRNEGYKASIPAGGIEFQGDPDKVRTYMQGVGWHTKDEHARLAAQRAVDADKAFEKWERENHPAKAGLRAFNDSLIHVGRKLAVIPGGFLDTVLPRESGLHQDHIVHKVAKAVDPLVDVALAAVGAGLQTKTKANSKMEYEHDDLFGGAPRLRCPHCDKMIPKKQRKVTQERRDQLRSDGQIRAYVFHELRDEMGWTRLTDASKYLKDIQIDAEKRGHKLSLLQARDIAVPRE